MVVAIVPATASAARASAAILVLIDMISSIRLRRTVVVRVHFWTEAFRFRFELNPGGFGWVLLR